MNRIFLALLAITITIGLLASCIEGDIVVTPSAIDSPLSRGATVISPLPEPPTPAARSISLPTQPARVFLPAIVR